jgi:chromosome transmission fidelity protein 4
VIEVSDQDIHHVVNVEFHDRTARKSYHFQDTFKYNMASLGERGILYACAAEEGHPAKIEYKPYATWASTSEWTYDLPEGETAVALAAGGSPPSRSLRNTSDEEIEGNGMAIVGTNNGFIRFFTGGGLERYIWHLGEDIISMVAGREWVFVVHREGGTSLDGMSFSIAV